MHKAKLIHLLLLFWALSLSQGLAKDFRIVQSAWPYKQKLYSGVIQKQGTPLYAKPDVRSKVYGRFNQGDTLSILSRTQNGFLKAVLFSPKTKKFTSAFVSATQAELLQTQAPLPQKMTPPHKPALIQQKSSNPTSKKQNLGVDFALIRNIWKYGAHHNQVSGVYAYPVWDKVSLGVTLGFGYGDVFKVFQGGLLATWRFFQWSWQKTAMVGELGGLAQQFRGNGKSFYAGSVQTGIGLEMDVTPAFKLRLMPLTVDTMVLRTEAVPLNVRYAPHVGLFYQW